MSDWAEAIASHLTVGTEEKPDDSWKTLKEIAAETGMSRSGTENRVLKLVRLGQAEGKVFLTTTGAAGKRSVKHYRLLDAE